MALGAFAAHALKNTLAPDMLAVFETGVRYQMYHAFALFAAAWGFARWQARAFALAGWLFVAGIVDLLGKSLPDGVYRRALAGCRDSVGWPGISGRVALSRVGCGN